MGFIIIYMPAEIHTFFKWSKIDIGDIDKSFFHQGLRHTDGNFQ